MRDLKRTGAAVLCAVLVLTMVFSSAFIIHEAGHDCTGEDCPICHVIAASSQLLRLIGAAFCLLAWLLGVLCTGNAWAVLHTQAPSASRTLVSWKIRLNN